MRIFLNATNNNPHPELARVSAHVEGRTAFMQRATSSKSIH